LESDRVESAFGSVGSMERRYCVLKREVVKCVGICRGVFVSEGSTSAEVLMCPIYLHAFDLGMNREDKRAHKRLTVGSEAVDCVEQS
jgi:hypothetical protein